MFMIVLTTTLSDFIGIYKNLKHLLENHNSISIHPAKYAFSMNKIVFFELHTLIHLATESKIYISTQAT